jgi:hypothetical protein
LRVISSKTGVAEHVLSVRAIGKEVLMETFVRGVTMLLPMWGLLLLLTQVMSGASMPAFREIGAA